MSKFHKIELHRKQLEDLQAIIGSMKTIAQLERYKLASHMVSQEAMERILGRAADEIARVFPPQEPNENEELWIVIGSERGLCGSFNELLVDHLLDLFPECVNKPERVLTVGRKLSRSLEKVLPIHHGRTGAVTGEEISGRMHEVVATAEKLLKRNNLTSVQVLYHADDGGGVTRCRLLPPEKGEPSDSSSSSPVVYLKPERLFHDFLFHSLFLGLIRLFTLSLFAENSYRLRHLGAAVHRLDGRLAQLRSKARLLRQEEITQEIAMILLGSGAFDR